MAELGIALEPGISYSWTVWAATGVGSPDDRVAPLEERKREEIRLRPLRPPLRPRTRCPRGPQSSGTCAGTSVSPGSSTGSKGSRTGRSLGSGRGISTQEAIFSVPSSE